MVINFAKNGKTAQFGAVFLLKNKGFWNIISEHAEVIQW